MTDILADYREWRAQQPESCGTHTDRCHLYHPRCMIHRLAAEVERARLTDAEREALHWFAHYGLPEHRAATLRGLLERTRNGSLDGRGAGQ